MIPEIYQPQVDELKARFIKLAEVRDAEKGYIVAKEFNLAIDPNILYLASQAWQTYFQDKVPIDAIVGLPDAGSRLVPFLAHMLKIPAILPSKRTAKVPGAWKDVVSFTNYSFTLEADITSHIGFVKPGQRLLVVDDVIAHGSTAIAALHALQAAGAEIVGLAVLFDKAWQNGVMQIIKETGINVCSLISIQGISKDNKPLV